jgi:hypothetical protein
VSTSADVSVNFQDELQVGVGLPQPLSIAFSSDPLSVGVTEIPKLSVGIDPLTIEPLQATLAPLTVEPLTLTIKPLDLSISLKELPSIRAHLPAHFTFGLSILGRELFCARVCGEAQVITEPYEPNPCERCSEQRDDKRQQAQVRAATEAERR